MAEILSEEATAGVTLDTSRPLLRGACPVDLAVDYVEALAQTILVDAQLEVFPRRGVTKQHSAPLDIENAVGRTSRCRDVDTACSTGIARAAGLHVGLQILEHREDIEIMGSPWDALADKRAVGSDELSIAVG